MTDMDASTKTIPRWFEKLSSIPRESDNETAICARLVGWCRGPRKLHPPHDR